MDINNLVPPSNRILYDVPCEVCSDHSSGKHYGVFACDGCAGFFKRSVRRDRQYGCKSRTPGACLVDKAHRNQCRACRLAKCLSAGMNRDAVQGERGPRNSTIRRQMSMIFKRTRPRDEPYQNVPRPLNLSMPSQNLISLLPVPRIPNTCFLTDFRSPNPVVPLPRTPDVITSTISNLMDPKATCESAARILFMNVKWVKSIPAFNALSLPDRMQLLEWSWKELFLLGTAQFLYPLDLETLINPLNPRLNLQSVQAFETALTELARVRPDANEYTCLRSLALFKTNIMPEYGPLYYNQRPRIPILRDVLTVAALQEQSRVVLIKYVSETYPTEIHRVNQLLRILDLLDTVPGQIIDELFFRDTIGSSSIQKIIGDVYQSRQDPI